MKQGNDLNEQHEAHDPAETIRVTCPGCAHQFPLGEAVLGGVRADLSRELQGGVAKREAQVILEQKELQAQKAGLKQEKTDMDERVLARVDAQLEKQTKAIQARAEKKAAKAAATQHEVTIRDLEQERDEKAKALKTAREEQLKLLQEKRALKETQDNFEIEKQKQIDTELEKQRKHLSSQLDEENRLKMADQEKKLADVTKQLKEAQRKAEQGSMQTQGEVGELDVEVRLQQAFPTDEIEAVPTGTRGADLSQRVRDRKGANYGSILLEVKRTKKWQDEWTAKLNNDMRGARADVGVIITETLPKGIDSFGEKDGVWVCDYSSALALIYVLRVGMKEVTLAKGLREGAKEKAELLYEYLTGNEFSQRVRTVVDAFKSMRVDLDKEKAYMITKWNKREKQIGLVIDNMAGILGDVDALSGGDLEVVPLLDDGREAE